MTRKRLASALVCLGAVLIVGCPPSYVAPEAETFQNEWTLSHSYDEVWGAVIEALADSNLTIANSDKESGIITTTTTLVDMAYTSCAGGYILNPAQRRGTLSVFIKKLSETSTRLKINGRFEAYSMGIGAWGGCNSSGILEDRVYHAVLRTLGE